MLVPRRWLTSVGKCDADTDHNLVRMKFKLKLHKVNKARPKPRYDFSERDKFELELRNRFELLDTPEASDPGNRQSAETEWQTLKPRSLERPLRP